VSRAARAALLLLLLAACSDDGEAAAPTTSAPTTTATATTTTATTSPSTTATTCPPDGPATAVDLDADGVDELLVPAGSGAAVDIVELHRLDGCDEVAVTLGGLPAQFAVGGSVLQLEGLRCGDGTLEHRSATSADGDTYATVDVVYELQDGALVEVDRRTGELPASDPALLDYARLDC
jgi:hypothetical protein